MSVPAFVITYKGEDHPVYDVVHYRCLLAEALSSLRAARMAGGYPLYEDGDDDLHLFEIGDVIRAQSRHTQEWEDFARWTRHYPLTWRWRKYPHPLPTLPAPYYRENLEKAVIARG